jgi:ergothioneine biosynthesis protein EgtB
MTPPSAAVVGTPVVHENGRSETGSPLRDAYLGVRAGTERLCAPLEKEDYILQSMPDASPAKWHVAHTSWFFETFVLAPHVPGYRPFRPEFSFLFNSYYNAVGPRWPRPQRGLLSRPTVEEVYRYRAHVDEHMLELLGPAHAQPSAPLAGVVELGLNHEQQHQELILTDLKHALAANPLRPAYRDAAPVRGGPAPAPDWLDVPEGLRWIGHASRGFAFDNEGPRHRVFVGGFRLSNRLVTNGEYLAFMTDDGYRRPEFWLSEGWAACQANGWSAPLYWEGDRHGLVQTLSGPAPLDPAQPVCHVSFYEADAFARWAGARLPTEPEWETAAAPAPPAGHFLESEQFHPQALIGADDVGPLVQLYGTVWQWTASPYVAYPGYHPAAGALGEYNGKFMCNQMVLRGASCVTPRSHARLTYRNFFQPEARWQFTGIRLAQDLRGAGA